MFSWSMFQKLMLQKSYKWGDPEQASSLADVTRLKVPKSDSIIHDPIERCPLYFIVVTGINGSSYEASLVALIKICTYKRMFNHKTLQLSNKAITINIMCQVRLGQVRLGQVKLGQVRLGQVRLGQVRLGQVRLGQVRLGQVRLSSTSCVQSLLYTCFNGFQSPLEWMGNAIME